MMLAGLGMIMDTTSMELNSTVKIFFVIDTLLVGTVIKSISKEGLQNIRFD